MLKMPHGMTERDLERRLAEALVETLERVPSLRVRPASRKSEGNLFDFAFHVTTPAERQVLICEVKANGQPRYARQAIHQLLGCRQEHPAVYRVFLAPYISPGAGALCRAEGVGYHDLAGNCRLAFGSTYIERQGNLNPAAQKRELRSLYWPKAERALRVLLLHPGRFWKTQPLASEARISLGQVANVKKLLGDREWVEVADQGFRLTQPEALLGEWASQYRQRSESIDLLSIENVAQIEAGLLRWARESGIAFALTEFSAAARLAPYVRHQRVTAYWGGDVETVKHTMNLKAAPSGSNVRLLVPHDEGVFYGVAEVNGMPVVCPVQAFLDLHGAGLRSEDAANEILEQVLRRQW